MTLKMKLKAHLSSIIHSIDTNHSIFENPNNEQEQNIDKELDGSLIGEARKTTDEIYDLYCKHAAIIDFSVRKGKNRYKQGTTIVNGKYFYCSAAGIRDPPKNKELKNEDDQSDAKKKERRKRVMITRTKCEAQIFAKMNQNGDFEIEKHVVVYNHPLTREISNYLHRSERQMTEPKKEAIEAMSECGLRPMESYRYMSTETGGDDCVGHTMINHLNYCYKLKMKQIDGKNSQTLVNKLTNKYNLICAPFVGINNHWKNTMFACAFIGDEITKSFVWVFETFLNAMGGEYPISIFTDQDAAIAAGIEQVFPSSRHRLCLWHLSKNANSRFGLLKSDKNFKNAFYKCLSGCITPNDFEETWKSMINTFKLEKDDWFNKLYGLKEKWCTTLSKDFFSAGILSSQRSESTNHAAANIYTITLFRDFEEEIKLSVASSAKFKGNVGRTVFFEVWIEGITGSRQEVQFKMEDSTVTCTCKNFEESGWLCFHCLRILHLYSINTIPDRYITTRWTRYAKKQIWERVDTIKREKGKINNFTGWRLHMIRR
ncbi:protein FAR1-RELATED SEQUENCE 5-like [Spinacia oleracea]|uniref:Protein FAR1-RELATED SEQUENCE 5-like n=1 Tax=Spinacia oleracea TaxID=3562 RepID=A0ABM3RRD2_SPIOL|nr:protein FAR1-RELATED SEQUENCE 5-like [Spinacia oleracea]